MTTLKVKKTPPILESDLLNDFDRYPLPICFDPQEELKQLHFRDRRIKEIYERFCSIYGYKN